MAAKERDRKHEENQRIEAANHGIKDDDSPFPWSTALA